MKTKTMIIIGLSIVAAGGLGFWLYKRNKNKKMIGSETGNTTISAVNPNQMNQLKEYPSTPNVKEQPKVTEVKAAPKNIGAE
jgi:LPXTG-motif cell wall-anchored protein